jgi:hypothetical protein
MCKVLFGGALWLFVDIVVAVICTTWPPNPCTGIMVGTIGALSQRSPWRSFPLFQVSCAWGSPSPVCSTRVLSCRHGGCFGVPTLKLERGVGGYGDDVGLDGRMGWYPGVLNDIAPGSIAVPGEGWLWLYDGSWFYATLSSALTYVVLVFVTFFLLHSDPSLIHWFDCHDHKRTMVVQTVLVMHLFSSLVPRTRMLTWSCPLERSTHKPTGADEAVPATCCGGLFRHYTHWHRVGEHQLFSSFSLFGIRDSECRIPSTEREQLFFNPPSSCICSHLSCHALGWITHACLGTSTTTIHR